MLFLKTLKFLSSDSKIISTFRHSNNLKLVLKSLVLPLVSAAINTLTLLFKLSRCRVNASPSPPLFPGPHIISMSSKSLKCFNRENTAFSINKILGIPHLSIEILSISLEDLEVSISIISPPIFFLILHMQLHL
ncbi:hypothetical protein D3C76_1190020 [compost metagenome]